VHHAQGFQCSSAAAAVATASLQQALCASQIQECVRSNHTASCSHDHSHHEHGHNHKQQAPVSFEEQEATCWSCHDRFHRGGLVCQACDRIQPSDPTLTHFDILGL
jgi:hypothetical protein